MYNCFNCGAAWESSLRQPAVKETCERCGAYLHCCRNCTYHRKGYPNECYIPDTVKVADKGRTNFCDEFEFVSAETLKKRTRGGEAAGEAFHSLFGDAATADKSESEVKEFLAGTDKPLENFDDLFGD